MRRLFYLENGRPALASGPGPGRVRAATASRRPGVIITGGRGRARLGRIEAILVELRKRKVFRAAAEPALERTNLRYLRALLLAEEGRDADVVATLQETLGSTWLMVSNVWGVPRSRVLLARSLHR